MESRAHMVGILAFAMEWRGLYGWDTTDISFGLGSEYPFDCLASSALGVLWEK